MIYHVCQECTNHYTCMLHFNHLPLLLNIVIILDHHRVNNIRNAECHGDFRLIVCLQFNVNIIRELILCLGQPVSKTFYTVYLKRETPETQNPLHDVLG